MTETRHFTPTTRRRGARRAVLIGAASLTLLVGIGPTSADAGTYTWTICRDGNAVGSAASGDRVQNIATYGDQYATPCHSNNNNHETSIKKDQLTVYTNLQAPDGALFTSMRINTVGNNYSYNNAWGYLYNAGSTYYRCSYYDQDFGGGTICDARGAGGFNTQIGRDYALGTGTGSIQYGIYCRSQTGCGVGTLDQLTNEMIVTVEDSQGPSVSLAGEAWTGSSLRGAPNLAYSVDDNAAGGKGLVVSLDGTTVADTRSADGAGCNGDYWHRCPDDDGKNVAISLGSVADGQRSMQVIAYDDLGNPSTPRTRTVLVDNVPPTLSGTTVLTGKAEQGEQLTCVPPAVDGQSPTLTYGWFRSNPDGTSKTQIPGQTSAAYLQTSADIGKKIACLFSAKDGGGTSSSESSITAGPFANGQTVAAGRGPQPSGPTVLTSSGTTAQPHAGDTLEIKAPPFSGTSPTFAYSWLRCDSAGRNCAPIDGATSVVYTLGDADKDHRVAGQVVASDATGSTTSTSTATGLVTAAVKGSTGAVPERSDGGTGSTGTSSANAAADTVVHLAPGEPNGANACRDAKLTARFVTGSRTTVGFGRPATLRGRLTCNANGLAIANASVGLAARTYGTTAYTASAVIRTDANGQFTRVLKRGPGRQLSLGYIAFGGDRSPAATSGAMLNVRGRVSLRRMSGLVKRNYGAIVFSGRLYGGGIPRGFKLLLQAQDGKRWRLADGIAVKRDGSYRHVFRCKCAVPGSAYNFRVMIPSSTRLPYVPTHSRTRRVRVR